MTKEIDWSRVDNMLISGSNGVECASAIGICPETLYLRCRKEKKLVFSVYSQQKKEHGDAMLRAAQYQLAINDKNPTMLIWLGKVRLGQREQDYAPALAPNQKDLDKDHIIMSQANELAELKADADKPKTE